MMAAGVVMFDTQPMQLVYEKVDGNTLSPGVRQFAGTYITRDNNNSKGHSCTLFAQVMCGGPIDCVLPTQLHLPNTQPAPAPRSLLPLAQKRGNSPTTILEEGMVVTFFDLGHPSKRAVVIGNDWWLTLTPDHGFLCHHRHRTVTSVDSKPVPFCQPGPNQHAVLTPVPEMPGTPGLITQIKMDTQNTACPQYQLSLYWPYNANDTKEWVNKFKEKIRYGHVYSAELNPLDQRNVTFIEVTNESNNLLGAVYDSDQDSTYVVYVVASKDPIKAEQPIWMNLFPLNKDEEEDNNKGLYRGFIAIRVHCSNSVRPVRTTMPAASRAPVLSGDCPGVCVSIGGGGRSLATYAAHNTPHHAS